MRVGGPPSSTSGLHHAIQIHRRTLAAFGMWRGEADAAGDLVLDDEHILELPVVGFGPEVEAISKAAIERRYRMLPYIYTLFRESSLDGLPIWRPVFFADPADARLRDEDHAFLLKGDVFTPDVIEEWVSYKMENEVKTPISGEVVDLRIQPGDTVSPGTVIAIVR